MEHIVSVWENFGGGNFGEPYRCLKAIGEENLVNKLKTAHMPNTFSVYL